MLKLSAALAAIGMVMIVASALAAPAQPPPQPVAAQPAPAASEVGRTLFIAKGCVSCHHHAAIAGSGPFGGDVPDLSAPRHDAEFLRRWLADPAAVRPGTPMPRLGLSDGEIAALIAFLGQGKG